MRNLLTPRWILAHAVVLIVATVFINLGFWQLRRLEERRLDNAIAQTRNEAPPEDITVLLEAAGSDHDSLRYRRATVTGTYETEHQVLTRNQVYREQAGFHVIDVLATSDGDAILVNRGWVPLALDTPPISNAAPPTGAVTISGWISPTQTRPALGPVDPPEGDLAVMSRVDIDRIQHQTPHDLEPVYLVLEGEQTNELPVPLDQPSLGDEGSHLAYAIQWFGFTIIGIIGYVFLVRRQLSNPRSPKTNP